MTIVCLIFSIFAICISTVAILLSLGVFVKVESKAEEKYSGYRDPVTGLLKRPNKD